MYKIGQDPGVLFGNVQIQPSKFEPLESGKDSVDINLSGSDSSSEQYQQRKNRLYGLVAMVSLSEYIVNCCSQISNRLINKVYLRVFALFYFAKDDVYNFLSVSMKS